MPDPFARPAEQPFKPETPTQKADEPAAPESTILTVIKVIGIIAGIIILIPIVFCGGILLIMLGGEILDTVWPMLLVVLIIGTISYIGWRLTRTH